jgi:tetratricopeptide (TPR) repeat protein
VWKANPDDADIGALFVESLMDLRPWDLWTQEGKPQPGTEEIVGTLESLLTMSPNHPMALHLYIHVIEASPYPEKADVAAERLRDLAPGLGHLVHMPSHIDVRRGRWVEAISANQKAIEADRKYRQRSPHQKFYGFYISHNYHMLAYAAMMQGQSKLAIRAVDELVDAIPKDFLKEKAAFADGYLAMPFEFRMRFGRWDEILSYPQPDKSFPLARALWHFTRGVAFAVKGRFEEAHAEQKALLDAKAAISPEAFFGNNTAEKLLSVAEHMLAGEILFLSGDRDKGIAELQEAVKREDDLRYDEPPDWVEPVRHALGAALLRAGRAAEAEEVYREDLKRLPMNGWSLYGLARSLRLLKKDSEAAEVEAQFSKVWQYADVTLASSCFCQSERDVP